MRLRTLGGLALEGSDFRRPKPLLLLTYLSIEGARDRRHLSQLFWPGAAEPMTSLRVALSQIRRSAPEAVAAANVRLEARIETDASLMLREFERGAYAPVVKLYLGPFLDGFYLRACGVELEDWVYATRELLADRVREALLRLAETQARAGDFAAASDGAEAAHGLPGAGEPAPETIRRIYLLSLAGHGPRAAEIERLAREYGMETGLTSSAARDRLTSRGAHGWEKLATRSELPTPTTSFVGRDLELVELSRLLSEPGTRLVTITGPGGVGKSRLALQAAHGESQAGSFGDGVFFVPLEALADPALIAATIAEAVGVALPDVGDPCRSSARSLGDRNMLLVLDNYEHLMAGTGFVLEMVAHGSDLKVLVTSRERLGLEAEQLFVLGGLPLPHDGVTLGEARYLDAVQLFLHRAKRVDQDFSLSEETLPGILAICRSLEGTPLAIELAAAWTRMMPVGQIAAEIERSLDIVASTGRCVRQRHRSLRATFDHSWTLLAAEEQDALRKLSVFVGGFSREAAARVAYASIPRLAALVDKSLLRTLESGRYDRHPLLYEYTQEKLAERPEEWAATRARHANYFVVLAEEAEAQHQGPHQIMGLDRLEREQENLRAALEWTLGGGDPELGRRLAAALYHFWYYRSRLQEGERWLARALEVGATGADPDPLRPKLLSAAGALASERGDVERAVALFQERLALSRAQGDRLGQAAALNSLGVVAWGRREHARARTLMEASLRLRRELGRQELVGVSLNNLGLVALVEGRLEEARSRLEESLVLARGIGDDMGIAMALANLGAVALEALDAEDADAYLSDALPRYRALGDVTAVAQCLEGFAAVAGLRHLPEVAARLAGAAEVLREEIGATLSPQERARHERELAAVRATLGEASFAAAWREGRGMSIDEAVRHARWARFGA